MQIVFQDPFGALSPRMSVSDIITEGLSLHEPELNSYQKIFKVRRTLEDVGLEPDSANRYPHEFSGGQRQRIAIARAIILNPRLVVLDEPTSALDRSVQAQIVTLLQDLQQQRGLSFIFISHDLKVVRALAHRVMVMKDGKVVETGTTHDIFENAKETYTRELISAAFDL
jgi:microcin C transport system ATP-binding protein